MRIYIAGPLNAENAREMKLNADRAIEAGCKLMAKGHSPYIPHLSFYVWTHPAGGFNYEDWMELGFSFLETCEGFLFLAPSPGADREYDRARKLGLKIFYSVDEVPKIAYLQDCYR